MMSLIRQVQELLGFRPSVTYEKLLAAPQTDITNALLRMNKTGNRRISLANFGLTEIPEEIFDFADLEIIDLSNNKLKSVPRRLRQLTKLQHVNLTRNPIKVLPDIPGLVIDSHIYLDCHDQISTKNILELRIAPDISQLDADFLISKLSSDAGPRRLSVGQCAYGDGGKLTLAIWRILESLANFVSLESLSLCKLPIEILPEGIRELRRLKHLSLDSLGLKNLPDWIGTLELDSLSASGNELTCIPDSFRNLQLLTVLDLSGNPLERIPAATFDLVSLRILLLDVCDIREIPADILQLPYLSYMSYNQAPKESPPPEIANKGWEAIRDYWRQRADAGVDYLCEAKLIILGEPGAGKTSLARKIKNPTYQLRGDEESTEGIDVIRYQFPTGMRIKDDGKEIVLKRNFQASIWDFGGQEIYHSTHQFFLTRRSVYVLVCDDRKEDTDFSYWLHVVEMLSDASPLLIVQNEKQDRKRDINLSGLRAQFANLRGAFAINLNDNRGLDEVVQAIKKELEGLSHVGVGLPATWKRVREALEQEQRDYISLDDYLAICQRHGFTRDEDKLQLSGYLHDLGICLHFQDDPLLKHIVVLKPAWGTDAVYRVLDDSEVIAAWGRFGRKQLGRIWHEAKYAGKHDELLALMMKFQLCYALETKGTYISPQLLSSERPAYPWDAAGDLVLRYEYEFMPKGILTRFIVAMNHLIAGGGLVWKTGVVLERDGCRAEIIEEYFQKRIRVRVSGAHPQGLLAIIDEQLARLHASFPRLKVERFLPCSCEECAVSGAPDSFALEKLVKMARKGSPIQCHASGEMVDAARLVQDILPGAVRRDEYAPESDLSGALRTEPAPVPEVFVSYAWGGASTKIVDSLQQAFDGKGIRLIRDKEEVRYRDSIRDFMKRIGQGKCVVVVISEKYLKSENCMFELVEVAKAQELRERIFPIVLPDANIYRATGLVAYIQHWENEIRVLDEALKKVRGDNLKALHDNLDLYAEIRRLFDGIADTLRDMNALTIEMHEDGNFDEIIRGVQARLGS